MKLESLDLTDNYINCSALSIVGPKASFVKSKCDPARQAGCTLSKTSCVAVPMCYWLNTTKSSSDYYIDMFTDRRFQTAFFNSSLYVVCIVPFMVILPLMLASLVAEKTRIMNFFRTAFYTPVIMSSVVVGLLWTNILDKDGLLNGTFKALKWITTPIPFLTDRWLLLFSAMAVTIWSGLGYYMLIYLANIANIDSTLYEAASIDGCGGIRQFLHVTLPGCRMTMILVMLLSSMSAFRVFGEIYMLSGGSGGVGGADLTMTMLIKQEGTGINARTGYSGALGMVMFVVLGCIIGIEWFIQSRSED